MPQHHDGILIIDFGSQYTQLIARRVREAHVYCEIHPPSRTVRVDQGVEAQGASSSPAGPTRSTTTTFPRPTRSCSELGTPVLGLCYGMQLMAHLSGGNVTRANRREYGRANVRVEGGRLFRGFGQGEETPGLDEPRRPRGCRRRPDTASPPRSDNSPIAAIEHTAEPLFGVQFHPEVAHTPRGRRDPQQLPVRDLRLRSRLDAGALRRDARSPGSGSWWVPISAVICGLSGGVDSSVAAVLVHRAVGDRLTCIFVDHGLLRLHEREQVETDLPPSPGHRPPGGGCAAIASSSAWPASPIRRRSGAASATRSSTSSRPRRRRSGRTWGSWCRARCIPTSSSRISPKGGPSVTIKTHHNVGGLPERLPFKLLEPLRELFKDEVRQVGRELGLPEEMVGRHPFPGPGLAIRILGEVTRENLEVLRRADHIYIEEIRAAGLYDDIWQAFAVLLPIRSVGVQGDFRTYDQVIALRAVTSRDGMTADWFPFPPEVLGRDRPTGSPTRWMASIGWCTTSARSRPPRSSGSELALRAHHDELPPPGRRLSLRRAQFHFDDDSDPASGARAEGRGAPAAEYRAPAHRSRG